MAGLARMSAHCIVRLARKGAQLELLLRISFQRFLSSGIMRHRTSSVCLLLGRSGHKEERAPPYSGPTGTNTDTGTSTGALISRWGGSC